MFSVIIQNTVAVSKKPGIEKPLILILMGPPGSGKGTHAVPLSAALHLPHISTGDLFRFNIRERTALGQEAKSYIEQGKLVPDALVLNMLLARIQQPDCAAGCILDGFPRTIPQAEAFGSLIGNAHLTVIHLKVSDALLLDRVSGRLACRGCSKTYHIRSSPPRIPHVCDVCASPLFQRSDDREEILRERLVAYHRETEPLISYYAMQPGALYEVNAALPAENVFLLILEVARPLSLPQQASQISCLS